MKYILQKKSDKKHEKKKRTSHSLSSVGVCSPTVIPSTALAPAAVRSMDVDPEKSPLAPFLTSLHQLSCQRGNQTNNTNNNKTKTNQMASVSDFSIFNMIAAIRPFFFLNTFKQ